MTPYTILQLIHLGLAFVAAAVLFKATKLSKVLRASLILRLLTCEALLVALGTIAFLTLAKTFEVTRAFGVVAIVFYGGALWLPVFSLLSARRGTQSRVAGVLAALLAIGIGVDSFFFEPNDLELREEHMPVTDGSGEPFRLVHISDLQTVGHCSREDAAVEMINELNADLIVVTGDFVAGPWFSSTGGTGAPHAVEAARTFFGSLEARLGVVLIPGHSEPATVRDEVVAGLDVIYLKNAVMRFPTGRGSDVVLWGVDSIYPELPPSGLRRTPGDFVVVASHVPDFAMQMEECDYDLQVAGHTHGGQIVIPGYGAPLTFSKMPRKYARGLSRWKDHWINVTSGIGMEGHHAPRIRFQCPPEVVLIRIGGERDSVPDAPKSE